MLTELCAEIRNYFLRDANDIHTGEFTISGGGIDLPSLPETALPLQHPVNKNHEGGSAMTLYELCAECRNFFPRSVIRGDFRVVGGVLESWNQEHPEIY